MRQLCKVSRILIMLGMVTMLAACGSDDDGHPEPQPLTGENLAQEMVSLWQDVDFSSQNPDGTSDTDGDGATDTNDAVNFVETLRDLGYDVPPTTVQGLYENYHTALGYGQTDDAGLNENEKIAYAYTEDNPVTQSDLQAHDWSGLSIGDLIFVDFDKDFVWDSAAVYLGVYAEMNHAVMFASDYYDTVVITDLDDDTSILIIDIAYGYSDVRTPAYEAISGN